jgi:hypothetical protein
MKSPDALAKRLGFIDQDHIGVEFLRQLHCGNLPGTQTVILHRG